MRAILIRRCSLVALRRHFVIATRASSSSTPTTHPPVRAAYIHIPFCKRQCFYCDFPIQVVGPNTTKPLIADKMERYTTSLIREMQATTQPNPSHSPLTTIYFGGGTPSLLPPPLLHRILTTLHDRFGIAPKAEITLEADPGTFDATKLQEWLAVGINRFSIGVQAFQQHHLVSCGRAHSLDDVHQAIHLMHQAMDQGSKPPSSSSSPWSRHALESWSLDLIAGLPNVTLEEWRSSLTSAIAARPQHVSVYDLQIEEGTPFQKWYGDKKKRDERLDGNAKASSSSKRHPRNLPSNDVACDMYTTASELLSSAGYEHYEISNYSLPQHRSAHNQVYWRRDPFYGFGMGAASYLHGRRFSRPKDGAGYEAWVDSFCNETGPAKGKPGFDALPLESREEELLDTIMLSLRTADGLDLTALAASYGDAVVQQVVDCLATRVDRGQALYQCRRDANQWHVGAIPPSWGVDADTTRPSSSSSSLPFATHVRLTDPDGFLLSNDIISDIFAILTTIE